MFYIYGDGVVSYVLHIYYKEPSLTPTNTHQHTTHSPPKKYPTIPPPPSPTNQHTLTHTHNKLPPSLPSQAMVLALKELSIRGDIRTTVEYISVLMATEDFVKVSLIDDNNQNILFVKRIWSVCRSVDIRYGCG